ncbi:hypothetical protein PP175_13205 [Aneurinibacillus sp. Ricciae_BoGa-3]|uniref:HD-GYP domain-containing protein n=1 Tax=Aneurinibacillus sp. Ricciae_BoGa-3 TaxID=3022697 RepID=UPI00234026F8|nr:HD domain-containing phosphohydrolase [Aneurinibacillus sp. Ricciae_BoGa-3]WCK52416.1 hypothetical protein PP175_13205 [Aneurinibacillus sp. Ricciae_BoGa-3]
MDNKEITGKLGDMLILCMALLNSVLFVIQLIQWIIGSKDGSSTLVVSLGISGIIYWVFYLLHKSSGYQLLFCEHRTAFFCLSLFVFIDVFNPYELHDMGILLLLYPVIISLLQNTKVLLIWGSLSYVIYSMFVLFDPDMDLSNEKAIKSLIGHVLLGVFSSAVSWIISTHLSTIKRNFLEKNEQKDREYLVKMLHEFVPIVERKLQGTSKEIETMEELMRKIMVNFPDEKVDDWEIQFLSLLHYVSRIKWPDYLFEKKEKLTNYEYKIVQEHCFIASHILKDDASLKRVSEALYYHHERYDGMGYPVQLKGSAIPWLAQALGIVECFLAMTAPRSYRDALTPKDAFIEIQSMAGTAFSVEMVDALYYSIELPEGEHSGLKLHDIQALKSGQTPLVG